jgi:hypothetical protein
MNAATQANASRRGGARGISLSEIDWDYERKGRVLGAASPRKLAFFGDQWIGPLGVAFSLHRHLWHADHSITADKFADMLLRHVGEPRPANLDKMHLAAWVQASRFVALPEPMAAQPTMRALQSLAREVGLGDEVVKALGDRWKRPSELLALLQGEAADGWGPDFHPVDPIFEMPSSEEPGHDGTAILLGDSIVGDAGGRYIMALVGPSYTGKRRVIAAMIHNKRVPGTNEVELPTGERLPLFARNAKDIPFEQVIRDVAIFLKIDVSRQLSLPDQLNELIAKITDRAQRKENAAIYILANVALEGGSLVARLLSGNQLQELIQALAVPGGGGNRLLISGTDAGWLQEHLPDQIQIVKMEPPSLGALARTYGLELQSDEHKSIVPEGPLGVLMASILDEKWERDETSLSSARQVAQRAIEVCACQRSKDDIAHRLELRILAEELYNQIGSHDDAILLLKLLCLTEDGLRRSSIITLLRAGGLRKNNVENHADQGLDYLRTNLRYICHLNEKAGPWPDEDPPGLEGNGVEPLIMLPSPFRRLFELIFQRRADRQVGPTDMDDSGRSRNEFRYFNGLIAQLAREKARWRRLRAYNHSHDIPFGLARDAQALIRALIGIDRHRICQVSSSARREVSDELRHSALERSTFGDGIEDLDQRLAFRYLYFDIFRDDMDYHHRLSVQHQRDDLRLTLLLSFGNPGRPIYLEEVVADVRQDDSASGIAESTAKDGADINNVMQTGERGGDAQLLDWNSVKAVLPNASEQTEFLTSLAITAKRAGAWNIVDAVVKTGSGLVKDGVMDHTLMQRVYRCGIDAEILRCGRAQSGKTLRDLQRDVEELIDALSRSKTPGAWRAKVKLQSRLGELLSMQGNLLAARKIFEEAEKEESYKTLRDCRYWVRSAFLGHGSRRYLRLLCELAEQSELEEEREGYLIRAQDINELNLGRATKAAGDRAIFAADRARILALSGRTKEAEGLISELCGSVERTITSLATRIEAEECFASVAISLIRGGVVSHNEDIMEGAKSSIVRLLRLTRMSGLPVSTGKAERLASCWLELAKGDRIDRFDPRSREEFRRAAQERFRDAGYDGTLKHV